MCFVLFENVNGYELEYAGIYINKRDVKKCDVLVCNEIKGLHINTELGAEDITFDTYDNLLDAIIKLGKRIYASTMIDRLNKAEHEVLNVRMSPPLLTEGNEIDQLIAYIRRIRDDYANYNFVLFIDLGRLSDEYMNAMLNEYPVIKYTIDKAKEHARELCYKSDDPDVTYWCDSYDPLVRAEVYAVPEDKRIIITFYVEDVGEVYRHVKGYQTAEEFLKALEDYSWIAGHKE